MTAVAAPAREAAPEVVEARAALALVPTEWRTDALESSVLNRAAVQALGRVLGERAAMAQVRQDVAEASIAKIIEGDSSGLDDLIAAQLERDAAQKLRSHLTVPDVDRAALDVAFSIAGAALNESDAAIRLPAVSYDAEVVAWRQFCRSTARTVDPPLPSDLDRAASKRAAALEVECNAALAYSQNWRQWTANPAGNELELLASAAGALEQRRDLAKRVHAVSGLIGQANRQRKDAGLTWTVEVAR